ncbi:MAG TPA: UPF0182 family protein [Gemmatimonadaceae bacterium]|nr:UPF0182 family protein [Gemmatimonadaceae bacterium]
MTPGRRLLLGLAAAAAVLLLGRILAVVYADYSWYSALGASALWSERARDVAMIHTVSAAVAGIFALINLFAIRRSIVSLAFPRRLGNVEFGEAVPARYLDRGVLILSLVVALLAAIVVPRWEHLALIKTGVLFGERDPFFRMDLSFYVAWLPLELSAYTWVLTVLVSVSAAVIGLYALTPSLRWERGAFRLSVHVRRHLAVLGALFLLITAWNYRLAGYRLLIDGTGVNGMFSYIDHQWLIPAYLSLSVVTVAAAALVLVSGWTGQLRTIFFTISAVLVFSIALDLVLPSVARRFAASSVDTSQQQPYAATRAAFTRRAYGEGPRSPGAPTEITRFSSFGDSARSAGLIEEEKERMLVYPGAHTAAIVRPAAAIPAPALGSGLSRLAHAWAEQRLDLIWGAFPPTARVVRIRDVRDRVRLLAPVFAQGSRVSPAFLGDTVMWVVELYSASATYPLSAHFTLAGEERSYFRHAGTALVNSRTGRTSFVSSATPDPVAVAWRERFPATFRAGGPDILDALTANPLSVAGGPRGARSSPTDSVFRREVSRLYARMRQALASGNLTAFATAYDSLGALIGRE